MSSKYLLKARECFLTELEDQIYYNVVEECSHDNLENEIKSKQKKGQQFLPKQIALLLKCVFKGILLLNKNKITHGNLLPKHIEFLEDGQTKLGNWYNCNRPSWKNDLVDACATIHQCVTLALSDEDFQLAALQASKASYSSYPGLYQFLTRIMTEWEDEQKVDQEPIKSTLSGLLRSLQNQNLALEEL